MYRKDEDDDKVELKPLKHDVFELYQMGQVSEVDLKYYLDLNKKAGKVAKATIPKLKSPKGKSPKSTARSSPLNTNTFEVRKMSQ